MNRKLITSLQQSWKREKSGAETYRKLAASESNEQRKPVLLRLADAEESHARRLEQRLAELGARPPSSTDSLFGRIYRWLIIQSGTANAIRRLEETEDRRTEEYENDAVLAASAPDADLLRSIKREEQAHSKVLGSVLEEEQPQQRLDTIFKREKWHSGRAGGWIGQAIYGANDGLGAVFGIVTGMAGYSGGGNIVWVAGIAGTLASALSMGSGAYLARKSEREVYEAEIERERKEIEQNPEEEREELELFYQLKGFSTEESSMMADRLMQRPDQFLKTLAQEELGLSSSSFPDPLKESLSATAATAVGGIIPVIPFLFTTGTSAVVISLSISTLAHFLVGTLKTIVTGRIWWRSGIEMTLVGLLTAAIAYGVGMILSPESHGSLLR